MTLIAQLRWKAAACAILLLAPATARADRIDDLVRAEMARAKAPGMALAVIHDGRVVKLQGYGLADVDRRVEVTPETIFKIGSVSKPIFAIGILLLAEDGRLSLEDPVSKYLADTPESWQGITIRHFLTHTSGVVREGPAFNPFKVQSDADVIRSAYPLPLRFPTGTKWEYCNVGYFSLAEIIHKVSGQSWSDFLAARIFRPLGMTSTFPTGTPDERRALGYDGEDNGTLAADWPAVRPSGAFLSSMADLVKLEAMLAGRSMLTDANRRLMWTPVALADGTTHPYGLGWELGERGGRKYIGHGGSLPGFRSTYARFPDDRLTIIVLTNADRVNRDGLVKAIADAIVPAAAPVPAR